MKKQLRVLAFVLLAIGVGFAGMELARRAYFYPIISEPDYPVPETRTQAWQQDLDFIEIYFRLNRPYTNETRAAARERIRDLYPNVGSLSDAELKLSIAEAVALSENGHSLVRLSGLTASEGRVPIMGRLFDDGYYILWGASEYEALAGAQVVSIDGYPVEEVIAAFRPYSGAQEAYFRLYVPWLLETPSLVHAIGHAKNPNGYVLGVKRPDSDVITEVRVEVDSAISVPVVNPNDILTSIDLPRWSGLPENLSKSLFFLQEWGDVFHYRTIESVNGFYIRYGANNDVGDQRIAVFNRAVRKALKQHEYDVIIVDQRDNNGGDYRQTARIMRDLPNLAGEETPIYVITGPQTFSAGISSVAFLKASGGEQITIVGTAMGDLERHWGETSTLILPNSQLELQLATGLHDYANGCHAFPECYWLDFIYNVAVGDLSPEVSIPFTFEDYVKGRDSAIEFVIQNNGSSGDG